MNMKLITRSHDDFKTEKSVEQIQEKYKSMLAQIKPDPSESFIKYKPNLQQRVEKFTLELYAPEVATVRETVYLFIQSWYKQLRSWSKRKKDMPFEDAMKRFERILRQGEWHFAAADLVREYRQTRRIENGIDELCRFANGIWKTKSLSGVISQLYRHINAFNNVEKYNLAIRLIHQSGFLNLEPEWVNPSYYTNYWLASRNVVVRDMGSNMLMYGCGIETYRKDFHSYDAEDIPEFMALKLGRGKEADRQNPVQKRLEKMAEHDLREYSSRAAKLFIDTLMLNGEYDRAEKLVEHYLEIADELKVNPLGLFHEDILAKVQKRSN